ncbi:MAG: hypothetical protein RL708_2223 [Bacteroidota bacterium]
MRIFIYIFAIFIATFLLSSSCKKRSVSTKVAITDVKGKVTLTIHVLHHAYALPNLKVYIKLAADKYPGSNTSVYDYTTTTNANGEATFNQLPLGNVWMFSTGYDASVGKDVNGNTGFIISSSSVDANYNASTDLYVSE